jgi:hypothetical protein
LATTRAGFARTGGPGQDERHAERLRDDSLAFPVDWSVEPSAAPLPVARTDVKHAALGSTPTSGGPTAVALPDEVIFPGVQLELYDTRRIRNASSCIAGDTTKPVAAREFDGPLRAAARLQVEAWSMLRRCPRRRRSHGSHGSPGKQLTVRT